MSGFSVFGKEPALATPEQISATEDVIGTRLPESLKAMLQGRRNGVRVRSNQLEQHPSVGVDRFLTADPTGPASIAERWKELRDSVPAWFIPIADCAGGICLEWIHAGGSSSGIMKGPTPPMRSHLLPTISRTLSGRPRP
ncbi:SMI1/KNR4 family protein [Terrabacter sp. 2YAF2]|uniref:SMI1/KNR4 family protein n=1 Tax=Terrabacter sp. 2YAF2 TaxID=3233026 RepID=UPI003F9BDE69